MDDGVSWRLAVLIAKSHHPYADMSTILYFAKQIYLAKNTISLIERPKKACKQKKQLNERLIIQGANI